MVWWFKKKKLGGGYNITNNSAHQTGSKVAND